MRERQEEEEVGGGRVGVGRVGTAWAGVQELHHPGDSLNRTLHSKHSHL